MDVLRHRRNRTCHQFGCNRAVEREQRRWHNRASVTTHWNRDLDNLNLRNQHHRAGRRDCDCRARTAVIRDWRSCGCRYRSERRRRTGVACRRSALVVIRATCTCTASGWGRNDVVWVTSVTAKRRFVNREEHVGVTGAPRRMTNRDSSSSWRRRCRGADS